MKKKKVAIVITQSELGGAQKHILLLAQELKDYYDITVYSKPGGKMVDELKKIGIKYIQVNDMVREINLIKDFKAYKFLLNEFKKNKYDVVHCHSSKAGLLGRIAAHKAKVKNIIYTAHGFVFNEPMSNLKKKIYIIAEKIGGRISNNIICVTPTDIEIAKQVGIHCKKGIEYIPNGIKFDDDETLKKEEFRKILEIDNEDYIFGLVANFYETKGHRYLIKAFNEFINSGYKAKLLLIGQGILMNEMKTLAKENENIKFLGFKSNASELVKSFDCFVMSSVKEGFPFVILEAAKKKVPIISTNVGAVKKIINENGIVVEPKNIEELKKGMIYAIENKQEMKNRAQKEYEYCKNIYSLDNMVKLTKNIYDRES